MKDDSQISRLFLVGRKKETGGSKGKKDTGEINRRKSKSVGEDGMSDLNMVHLRFLQDM